MVTLVNRNIFNGTLELYGLSTDEKPTDKHIEHEVEYLVANASTFYCMDTQALSMFDEDHHIWIEQS